MADGRDGRDGDRLRRAGAPALVSAAALVLLAALFLLQNLGLFQLTGNWWALFLLVPALFLAGTALTRYRAAGGRFTAAGGALSGALFLGAVALMFLLDLDLGVWWPVFVILAAVAALLNWTRIAGGAGRR
jgi:hypothetical protein